MLSNYNINEEEMSSQVKSFIRIRPVNSFNNQCNKPSQFNKVSETQVSNLDVGIQMRDEHTVVDTVKQSVVKFGKFK